MRGSHASSMFFGVKALETSRRSLRWSGSSRLIIEGNSGCSTCGPPKTLFCAENSSLCSSTYFAASNDVTSHAPTSALQTSGLCSRHSSYAS
jgi:hypothetical protein